VGRWREDVIEPSGKRVRIRKTEVLGTKQDLPTKKLALRELGLRLARTLPETPLKVSDSRPS
jgi:hypothetical protein